MNTNCVVCGNPISEERLRHRANTCSQRCANRRQLQRYHESNPPRNPVLTNSTVGAISEHRVIADLLSKGYSVFRSCSPNSPCDIAILGDGKLLRVEVTTGHYSSSQKTVYASRDPKLFDVLAIVLPEKIEYVPERF